MKLIRNMIMAVLFLAGVFLASANTGLVDLVYMPSLPLNGYEGSGAVQVPLFVLILASVLAGVLLTGLGTLFEQMRLRMTARSLRRSNEELQRQIGNLTRQVEEFETADSEARYRSRSREHNLADDAEDADDESGSVLGAAGRDD